MTVAGAGPDPSWTRGGCLWRYAAPALMLAAAALVGCNRPRSADDISVEVRLSRSFVREKAARKPVEVSCLGGWNWNVPSHGSGDAAWVALAVVAIVVLIATVEIAASCAGTTRAQVWPEQHPERYRQRLGWGGNRVYLPRSCAGQIVPMVVEFRGKYTGTHRFELDLAGAGEAKL